MKKIYFLFLFLFATVSFAQDGSPDLSFGDNGKFEFIISETSFATVSNIHHLGDDSYLVLARELNSNENFFTMIKITPEGLLDTSFGNDGSVLHTVQGGSQAFESYLINNEKILVLFDRYNPNYAIRCYNLDGSLDTNFGDNGTLFLDNDGYYNGKMRITNDNKIIFIRNDDDSIVIKKFLLDGSPDLNFGNNGVVINDELNLHFFNDFDVSQFDGSLYCSIKLNPNRNIAIAKFTPSGVLNTSFGTNGLAIIPFEYEKEYGYASFISLFENNDALIKIIKIYDKSYVNYIFRLSYNGWIRPNFGDNGNIILGGALQSVIQDNQRILISQGPHWYFGGYYNLYRYYSLGDLDTSFGYDNPNDQHIKQSATIIDNDGKIVVGMRHSSGGKIIVYRLNNNPLAVTDFESKTLIVTPNPTSGKFRVENASFSSENAEYKIADVSGKIIKKGVLENAEDTIDISFAEKGIYFLKIQNQTFKLIKN